MLSKNLDYGFEIDMTPTRAIRVMVWRFLLGESWRGISYNWEQRYPQDPDLKGNQFHGMTIADCAATTFGLRDYLSLDRRRAIKKR